MEARGQSIPKVVGEGELLACHVVSLRPSSDVRFVSLLAIGDCYCETRKTLSCLIRERKGAFPRAGKVCRSNSIRATKGVEGHSWQKQDADSYKIRGWVKILGHPCRMSHRTDPSPPEYYP